MHKLDFVLAFHNHQPIGNFDDVFENVYRDSYLPFVELLSEYPDIRISLHTSGSLLEWLVASHPEYIELLKLLVARGQVEILGGGFYEPILPSIPSRDRRGQIVSYSNYLERLFDCPIKGMWMPERVWEQSLVSDICAANIEFTVLDDFHFTSAGLQEADLYGYYLTEDDGNLLQVFPNSERLRYLIPWQAPEATIEHARQLAETKPHVLLVCADDGEKFGGWPGTHKHIFEDGWLRRLFDALTAEQEWLCLKTFSEASAESPPTGKIYLPDCSYREMTEWALPTPVMREYQSVTNQLNGDDRFSLMQSRFRGGFWRNFRVKYEETDLMYCRMLELSDRLDQISQEETDGQELITAAYDHLYRGQCNCSYWHGAFGGAYLPHLRNAVYQNLICCDNIIEQLSERPENWVNWEDADWNLDGRKEIRVANDKYVAYLAPAKGGHIYELDIRDPATNLLSSLRRRPETYHEQIQQAVCSGEDENAQTPDHEIRVKQSNLHELLQYDEYSRHSLIDHFYDDAEFPATLEEFSTLDVSDTAIGVYASKVRTLENRVEVEMVRRSIVRGNEIELAKTLTFEAGSSSIHVSYALSGLQETFPFTFSCELAFAGMAGNAPDRFYYSESHVPLGPLEAELDLHADRFGVIDQWLTLDNLIEMSLPARIVTKPIKSVSQSEGGVELVYQSSAVFLSWPVRRNSQGRWSVGFSLQSCKIGAELVV